MIYDYIVFSKAVEELKKKITGGMIVKIIQPSLQLFILSIRIREDILNLLFSIEPQKARIHITEENFSDPLPPHNFSLLMKKHIYHGEIEKIDLVPLERILKIDIKSRNEIGEMKDLALIVEIMGKHSNIILLSRGDRRILGAIKHISSRVNRHREIIPGEIYIPPPEGEKNSPYISEEKFTDLLHNKKEEKLEKALTGIFKGTSLLISKETSMRSGVAGGSKISELSEKEIQATYKNWTELWKELKGNNFITCLTSDKKAPWETPLSYPAELKLFKDHPFKKFRDFNKALDFGYKILNKEEKFRSKKLSLLSSIKEKKKKTIQFLKKQEESFKNIEKADEYRKKGDLILANLHLQNKSEEDFLEVIDYFSENQEKIKIKTDCHMTLSENAQKYFKKYKKAVSQKETSEKQIKELKEELEYLENIELSIEQCDRIEAIEEIREELQESGLIKEKKPQEKRDKKTPSCMTFTSPDGWEIIVGKNNKQNDYLTMKVAGGSDIWLHAKGIPGSHVIIKNRDRLDLPEIPQRTLLMAAGLAAYYSKDRSAEHVLIDYTWRKYVKKPKGSKPGMVIYHGEKSIYVKPEINFK